MSLRKPPPAANSSSGTRVSRRGVTLLLAAVACVLVVWIAFRPRVVTTPSGVRLGHLPPGVHPSNLNLLLVTLDTTRADRLGAYGFTAERDAESGSHRARRRPVRARRRAGAADPAGALVALHQQVPAAHMACATTADSSSTSDETTLAERLKAQGFRPAASSAPTSWITSGASPRGSTSYFDDFDLSKYRHASRSAASSVRATRWRIRRWQWLDTVGSSKFFAWVHFYDAHFAVRSARAVQIALCRSTRMPARSRSWIRRSAACSPGSMPTTCSTRPSSSSWATTARASAITARAPHGFFVYESVLHVPLMIRAPYDADARPDAWRTSCDAWTCMPTVLDLLGIPLARRSRGPEPDAADDRRRSTSWGSRRTPRRSIRATTSAGAICAALRPGRYKYIEAPRPELYDLEQDPREAHQHLCRSAARSAAG